MMNHCWGDQWKSGIYQILHGKGYVSVLSYFDSLPFESYQELASGLGNHIAPAQMQLLHSEESKTAELEELYLRSSFVRYLRYHVPLGIGNHGDWPITLALGTWAGSMSADQQSRCSQIIRKFKKVLSTLPKNWLPTVGDDVLERLFAKCT